jgi:hypothetical protein
MSFNYATVLDQAWFQCAQHVEYLKGNTDLFVSVVPAKAGT